MGLQVGLDRGDELGHGLKDSAAERLIGQLAEESLDEVDPRAPGGREVQVKAWVLGQPFFDVLVLVG